MTSEQKTIMCSCVFVHCILVTYGLHRKNRSTTTKVVAEHWLLQEEEDLVVYKVLLSGYCSKFNNTDDE